MKIYRNAARLLRVMLEAKLIYADAWQAVQGDAKLLAYLGGGETAFRAEYWRLFDILTEINRRAAECQRNAAGKGAL